MKENNEERGENFLIIPKNIKVTPMNFNNSLLLSIEDVVEGSSIFITEEEVISSFEAVNGDSILKSIELNVNHEINKIYQKKTKEYPIFYKVGMNFDTK